MQRVSVTHDFTIFHGEFDSLSSSYPGGAISCIGNLSLKVFYSKFSRCSSPREGGAIFLSGPKSSSLLRCTQYKECRVEYNDDEVGGNAITLEKSKNVIEDLEAVDCWKNQSCGNSVLMLRSIALSRFKLMNFTSDQMHANGDTLKIDNVEELVLEYGNFVELRLNTVISFFSNVVTPARFEWVNMVRNVNFYLFVARSSVNQKCEHGCFFGNSGNVCQSIGLTDCIGDFEGNGVVSVSEMSTFVMDFGGEYCRSWIFSDKKDKVKAGIYVQTIVVITR